MLRGIPLTRAVQERTLTDTVAWPSYGSASTFGPSSILDVQKFFDSGAFTDCQLIAKDGTIVRCHRLALAGASPVFEAMFTVEGMREAEECTAHLAADRHTLDLLLQFIYGKTVAVPLADAMTVYQLADQYQINAACSRLTSTIRQEIKGFSHEALCYIMHQAYEMGDAADPVLKETIVEMRRRLYEFGPDWLSDEQYVQKWHLGLLQRVIAEQPGSDRYRPCRIRVEYGVAAAAWVAADGDRMQHWEGLMQQLALERLTSDQIEEVKDVYPQLLQMPGVEAALQEATARRSQRRQRR